MGGRPCSHLLKDCCPCQRRLLCLLFDRGLALLLPQPCQLLPRQLPFHRLSSRSAHGSSPLTDSTCSIGGTLPNLAVELVVLVRGQLLELALLLLRASALQHLLPSQPRRAAEMLLGGTRRLLQHPPLRIGHTEKEHGWLRWNLV